jgi:hypothetical protein
VTTLPIMLGAAGKFEQLSLNMQAQSVRLGSEVSWVVNFSLETVIIPGRTSVRSSSLRHVYVDYCFHVG